MKLTSRVSVAVFTVGWFSGIANAADIPVRVPAPAPVVKARVHHDWTGWYGGFNYGSVVSHSRSDSTIDTGSEERSDSGFTVGAQLGVNWQFNRNWVAGLEGDIGWLGINSDKDQFFNPPFAFGTKADAFATVRGRLGYTSSPSLFYVTGGAAFVNISNNSDGPGGAGFKQEIESGWTAGWGIETMLGGQWSAKAEYLYINAGTQSVLNTAVAVTPLHFHNDFHVFRTGLNYRFGGAPAAPVPQHNWNGFYAGWFGGVVASGVQVENLTNGGFQDISKTGFTGGVQTGYNFHVDRMWVVGWEADIGYLGIDRTAEVFGFASGPGVETDWYGTLRGRIGRSFGQGLLYVTAGGAVVNVKNSFGVLGVNEISRTELASGWTMGGGIEAVLGDNWTAKAEYLVIDVGKQSITNTIGGLGAQTARFDNVFHVFRFGVSRKFGS